MKANTPLFSARRCGNRLMQWRLSKKQISSMMTVVVVLAGLASAQAATGNDQKSGAAVSPAGKTLLQGTVTGGGTDDVTVFWGPADGGMTPANWAHQQVLKDVKSDTPFSITAEPVVYGLTYYYRCQISGGGTAVWAEASTTFTGSKPRVAATGANNAPALPVTSSLACWYDAAVGVTYGYAEGYPIQKEDCAALVSSLDELARLLPSKAN